MRAAYSCAAKYSEMVIVFPKIILINALSVTDSSNGSRLCELSNYLESNYSSLLLSLLICLLQCEDKKRYSSRNASKTIDLAIALYLDLCLHST